MPDLVDTLTAAPGERPYSAEYGLVTTLNSWMASTEGRETWLVSSCTLVEMLLLSTPSRRKLFWRARAPWTFTPPVRPKEVPPPCSVNRSPCTPGTRASRSSQLRMARGSLATEFCSMTAPSAAWSVLRRRLASSTVTDSVSPPTPRVKSTRPRWPISRMTDCTTFCIPGASASMRYWPGVRFSTW